MNILKKLHKFIPGFRQLSSNSMIIAATYYGAAVFIFLRYWYWGLALLALPFLIFNLLDLNASRKGRPALIAAIAAGAFVLLGTASGFSAGGLQGNPSAVPLPSMAASAPAVAATVLPTTTPSEPAPSPVRTASTPATPPSLQPSATPMPEIGQYAYVASKNSTVFHKPDCASAKKIKPGNLVGFKTREEAIA